LVSVAAPGLPSPGVVVGGSSVQQGYCITQQQQHLEGARQQPGPVRGLVASVVCSHGFYRRGRCLHHGSERWVYIPCKRRKCPVCGPLRSRRISERIRRGIESNGSAAWFVGTFSYDIDKSKAVSKVSQFVQWLRRGEKEYLLPGVDGFHRWQTRFELKISGLKCPRSARWRWRLEAQEGLEYACTWELQKSGRLHCNLVMAPWTFVHQSMLSRKWRSLTGASVVWVERITNPSAIADEVTKAKHTKRLLKLCSYFAKNEQMVETGRGACYSEGWPLLAEPERLRRKGDGHILWENIYPESAESRVFESERALGHWREVRLSEWGKTDGDPCRCFDLADGSWDIEAWFLSSAWDSLSAPALVDKPGELVSQLALL